MDTILYKQLQQKQSLIDKEHNRSLNRILTTKQSTNLPSDTQLDILLQKSLIQLRMLMTKEMLEYGCMEYIDQSNYDSTQDINNIILYYNDNNLQAKDNGFVKYIYDKEMSFSNNIGDFVGSGADFALLNELITRMGYDRYRNFLNRIARLESGGNHRAQSPNSTASGWFQFIDGTRAGLGFGCSREEFKNSPIMQIECAVKFYNQNLNTAKSNGIFNIATSKGWSEEEIVAVMWLSPLFAKKYFLYGDASSSDANGTNVLKYREKYLNGK